MSPTPIFSVRILTDEVMALDAQNSFQTSSLFFGVAEVILHMRLQMSIVTGILSLQLECVI
jgi:hypothetical protein